MNSWETFESKKEECHKQLDAADAEYDAIKKIFDLKGGPADYNMRMKTASIFRYIKLGKRTHFLIQFYI